MLHFVAIIVCFMSISYAIADTVPFKNRLETLLTTHERIKIAEADYQAQQAAYKVTKGDWYPELEMTHEYGQEERRGRSETDYFYESKLKVKQRLWDHGTTNSKIAIARLKVQNKKLALDKARQTLLFDAVKAYVNLIKTHHVLAYSLKSIDNVRHQTGMEQTRVAEGVGYTTDVLQAKTQLASAISLKLRKEIEYIEAQNRYLEIFKTMPTVIPTLAEIPKIIVDNIPTTLDDALKQAFKNNIQLNIVRTRDLIAKNTIRLNKNQTISPVLQFSVEGSTGKNQDNIERYNDEFLAKLELKMSFNLGGASLKRVQEARFKQISSQNKVIKEQAKLERETRSNWQRIQIAQATSESTNEQKRLSAAFLALARKERQLGNRSLIDILSGETSLIRAESENLEAEADVFIAALELLKVTGSLDIRLFQTDE